MKGEWQVKEHSSRGPAFLSSEADVPGRHFEVSKISPFFVILALFAVSCNPARLSGLGVGSLTVADSTHWQSWWQGQMPCQYLKPVGWTRLTLCGVIFIVTQGVWNNPRHVKLYTWWIPKDSANGGRVYITLDNITKQTARFACPRTLSGELFIPQLQSSAVIEGVSLLGMPTLTVYVEYHFIAKR